MAGSFDFKDFEKMQKDLQKLQTKVSSGEFYNMLAKELTSRLYAKTVKKTPVGDYRVEVEKKVYDYYQDEGDDNHAGKKHRIDTGKTKKVKKSNPDGKVGGTLRRGWSINGPFFHGNTVVCDLINPVKYAPYVEFGHRQTPGRYVPVLGKCLKKSWVKGRFMLTLSVKELEKEAPKIIENKITKLLKETFE